ncbi:MAG TPA: hypothetical protein VHM69_15510 [Rubrobacter sp.]|nr:hypothetical protein [Rubrobacter sp.]
MAGTSPGAGIPRAIADAEGSTEESCCEVGGADPADVGWVAVVGPDEVSGDTDGVDAVGASTLLSAGTVAGAGEAATELATGLDAEGDTELAGSGDPAAAAVGVVDTEPVVSCAWLASLWSRPVCPVEAAPSSSELVSGDPS